MLHSLSRSAFIRGFSATFEQVFGDRSVAISSFANAGWKTAPLPYGFHLEKATFQALQSAALPFDARAVIADIETVPPFSHAVVIDLSREDWEGARCGTVLGHVDSAAFGESATWGLLLSTDDFGIIGGDDAFMDSFVAALGGESAVGERFEEFARSEWAVDASFRDVVLGDWFRR